MHSPEPDPAAAEVLDPSGLGVLRPTLSYAPYNNTPFGYDQEEPGEAKIPLSEYLAILRRHRWRILGFCAAVVVVTLIISARLTPIFESTATVDVDRQTPPGIVGKDAAYTALNDTDQFLATQVKLVQSDSVLRPVDQRFHLRERELELETPQPERAAEASVVLKQLRVTRPPNTYLLQISYRSDDPQLAADSTNAIAQSYLEHSYNIRLRSSASVSAFMERQLEELKAKMERSGMALAAFERDLSVVSPEEKTNIRGSRLLQLNNESAAAEGERLKKQAAFESVRDGSTEAALATAQGEPLRKLAERLNQAQEHFADVQSYYGANHPEYRRARAALGQLQQAFEEARAGVAARVEIEFRESQRREDMARQAVAEAKEEFDAVNARSFEYQAVKREADADKNLYEELVRKIKEAGINAGFQSSAIRIADPARPELKPVFPNIPLNGLLALLFSLVAAIGAAVLSDLLDKTVRDPEQVARTLRTEVIGSLPLMKSRSGQRMLAAAMRPAPDAAENDVSGFSESVRTLRNSILLANFERSYRSLLVTSAAPGEGKTTTAAHLAAAHAEQGRLTLLIDGDLRRPSVHRNFNLPGVTGLSNALLGELAWRDAVIRVEGLETLHVLPAGPPARRASDLVGRGLTELLAEAAADYDLVILDAPPLLGFAEPLQMATAVDGVIVVARAGETSRKAVASVLATLNRLRARVVGLVLNEVHKELSDSYYYYGYVAAPTSKGGVPEYYFHFDSWRVNVAPGEWVPAQIYIEEEGAPGGVPRFKAQTRIWDYAPASPSKLDELTRILIESDAPVDDQATPQDVSPLESQRSWERQAEENILARLEKGGFLAPAGPVDEVLNTVVANLTVSAKLNVEAHCRVLLTTPIETFSIGHTIVISRGLIDVLPDEASLALVLADELSHIALGHRTPTQFAFYNRTMLSDADLLGRVHFERTPAEMLEAGKKTIEIIRASPYQKTGNAGLFLKALRARGPWLPRLLAANLGNQVANGDALNRLAEFTASAPALEENKLEQIAGIHHMNPTIQTAVGGASWRSEQSRTAA